MMESTEHQTIKIAADSQLSGVEKVPVTVYADSKLASQAVAREIAELIRTKTPAGHRVVLGLATGNTPLGVYGELVRLHKQENLSFKNVVTFNLDEYYPIQPGDLQSYVRFMHENLFDHIDIDPANIHIPDGTLPRERVTAFCQSYEKMIRDAGGIDLQILGIGRTGHIGFNEPGSPRECKTRLITLDRITRLDAASDFFGEMNVPRKAITMGVDSVMSAKRVILMAWGEGKAPIIKRAVEGEVTTQVAASYLQQHPKARIILDPAAAQELTRFKSPWLLGPLEDFGLNWDSEQTHKAVIWLGQHLKKSVVKLTNEDYNEHGLQDLVASRGGAYDINVEVFRHLQSSITGWPGGKPAKGTESNHVDAPIFRHANPEIFPKRVVIFSPHPDDDVISMGGTLIRLCDQGHEVHVAYQTSGSIAVWDEAALRHADFVGEYSRAFGLDEQTADLIETQVADFIKKKQPGQVDSPEMLKIKTAIRRTEARSAARFSGVKSERIHFLDLPFYETGRVRKNPISEKDIEIVVKLLDEVRPHQIYAAGDLSDPHGTHRVCLAAITAALARLKDEPWMRQCEMWLYRGAWAEWEIEQIEMAVPLSPDELTRKRTAIFKHESQKDRAVFPGIDSREFWQRAEDRNRATAELYDLLGLAEYEAIEGFVRWKGTGGS